MCIRDSIYTIQILDVRKNTHGDIFNFFSFRYLRTAGVLKEMDLFHVDTGGFYATSLLVAIIIIFVYIFITINKTKL